MKRNYTLCAIVQVRYSCKQQHILLWPDQKGKQHKILSYYFYQIDFPYEAAFHTSTHQLWLRIQLILLLVKTGIKVGAVSSWICGHKHIHPSVSHFEAQHEFQALEGRVVDPFCGALLHFVLRL